MNSLMELMGLIQISLRKSWKLLKYGTGYLAKFLPAVYDILVPNAFFSSSCKVEKLKPILEKWKKTEILN